MPRRTPEQKRQRELEDMRISELVDGLYADVLSPIVEAAKRYESGEIDWQEFDAVIHGYTLVAHKLWSFLQQPRRDLLRAAEARERGEPVWDPIHSLALDQRHRTPPRKHRDLPGDLESAVATLTEAAHAAGRDDLVRTPAEWSELVLRHMKTLDFTGFVAATIASRPPQDVDEMERLLALVQNVWNATPMPDRGGRTPYEVLRDGRRRR